MDVQFKVSRGNGGFVLQVGRNGEEIQIFHVVETAVRSQERPYHPLSLNRITLRKITRIRINKKSLLSFIKRFTLVIV